MVKPKGKSGTWQGKGTESTTKTCPCSFLLPSSHQSAWNRGSRNRKLKSLD